MSDELRLALAFAVGCAGTFAATPAAIRLAVRTGFLDHPTGYKRHPGATPYLGGAALMAGFVAAAALFGGGARHFLPVILIGVCLWAVGTIDDRLGLGPLSRVAAEIAAAVALWAWGLGWPVFSADAANLALTVIWVVGLVNAFNLMDNMDGAAGTVGAVSAAGGAVVALLEGEPVLGALLFSMSGACAGFLPSNLTGPARIFLGDGGSMPLGFVLAAGLMSLPGLGAAGFPLVLVAAPIVGLPILDTALVLVSRWRRGVQVLSGGRDHLTHRLLGWLGSTRAVATTLGGVQACLCGLALALSVLGASALIFAAAAYSIVGILTIAVLETVEVEEVAPASVETRDPSL